MSKRSVAKKKPVKEFLLSLAIVALVVAVPLTIVLLEKDANKASHAADVATADLAHPSKKDMAMQLVSSAENSSLDWKAQYGYIEDIGDGRGYTGGIIGFCSGTSDMLAMVKYYNQIAPGNILAKYIPALESVDGTASHTGLGASFVADWKTAAKDPLFQKAQNDERDRVYFNPAVAQAKADGLRALGQFIYYDSMVMHGDGDDSASFTTQRKKALLKATPPSQGGNEITYLNAFLDERVAAMKQEAAHEDTSRVDTAQRVFLNASNFDLNPPLSWKVYGDPYTIAAYPLVTPTPATTTPTVVPTATLFPTATNTPLPTSTPIPTITNAPTPTPLLTTYTIYTDALRSGWTNDSYYATVSFTNTSPVYTGTRSIKFTSNKGWAGLGFKSPAGFTTSGYNYISFAVRATKSNQNFAIYAESPSGKVLKSAIALSNYGGYPSTTSWKVYKIPLSAINAANKPVGLFYIQNNKSSAQSAIYVDEVRLVK